MEKIIIYWIIAYTATISIENNRDEFHVPTTTYVFQQKTDTVHKTIDNITEFNAFYQSLLAKKKELDETKMYDRLIINSEHYYWQDTKGFLWSRYGNSYFPSFPKIDTIWIEVEKTDN